MPFHALSRGNYAPVVSTDTGSAQHRHKSTLAEQTTSMRPADALGEFITGEFVRESGYAHGNNVRRIMEDFDSYLT